MKFDVISPIDGSVYKTLNMHSEADVQNCLSLAKKAQIVWQETPLDTRKKLVSAMVDNLLNMRQEIGVELAWQMGRPSRQAANEPLGFAERVNYMTQNAETGLKTITPEPEENFDLYMKRSALGVVAVLSPWNYPFLTASNILSSALLAGNAVILKHSLQTPLVAERILKACNDAGFPQGVFQILHIDHASTATLIADKDIDGVFFTGSVEGGRKIQQAITEKFIPCGLELGGKDPAYVRYDADVDFAAENLIDGAFFNSGQSCCGIERIYVHENVYDRFIEKCTEITKEYVLGNPLDEKTTIGPMVKTAAADFVRGQIKDAVKSGAKSLIDESHFPESKAGTAYLSPHILVDVNHTMRVMTQETFGPVVGIMKVASDEEAITLMNDSDLGLTASVWTQDIDASYDIVDKVESGTVFVNRSDYLHPKLAWTGVKNTGRGISLSTLGFNEVTRIKSYHIRTKR